MSETISTTVTNDMRLILSPDQIGREGEHNSAVFKIVSQPASLDPLACRAEVQIAGKKTYRLVTDGEFSLTNDITEVSGIGTLQLVYSNGDDILRKTTQATFHVSSSINAIDPSDPTFQDGLAQLQTAAFVAVTGTDSAATFYNLAGQPVGALPYPPGQGGGLDEATANLLYVRRDGTNTVVGDLRLLSEQGIDGAIGIVLGGRQATIGWENGTVLRRGTAGEGVYIADNNGANRTPVITQQNGDLTYLRRDGGQMTGPLITATGSGATNPGLGVGDNATGFYRAGGTLLLSVGGAMYTQWLQSPPSQMLTVPLNMATQAIQNLADPRAGAPGVMDAVNRRSMDAAVAGVPRPNSRTYLSNNVDLTTTAQVLIDQLFPVSDNAPRTVTVTFFPTFEGGTPSQFHDLIFTCSIAPLIEARCTVYPTANAYMQSPVRFAGTVTPAGNSIQVQMTVRLAAAVTGTLSIIGSGTDKRSYVTIEEQQN